MSAMIVFDGIILAPLSDLSDQLKLGSQGVTVVERTRVPGGLQATGTGPKQVTVDPVDPVMERTLGIHIAGASRDVAEALRAWQGHKLLYRDGSGRLMYGVFFALRVVERLEEKRCDIYLTMTDTGDTSEV